jgi:hypothetical protein
MLALARCSPIILGPALFAAAPIGVPETPDRSLTTIIERERRERRRERGGRRGGIQ